MSRRTFVKRALWTLAGMGLLGGLYAWQFEPFWLEFVQVPMPIKNLPAALVGKRLMQISDMHVGKRFDYRFIIESLEKAKAWNPDFVVYTGDFINKDEILQEGSALQEVLASLVKGKLGTVGVLGNHDYGENWAHEDVAATLAEMLKSSGVKVLRNESVEIEGLNFIGFDDLWGRNFAPQQAMLGWDAAKANIALCHNPDVCDMDVWGDYDSWILSGHTHGGQVKPPFLPPLILPVKNKSYSAGRIDLSGGRTLYINRALGHLWQVRFNVRPEITIFELQKA